VPRPRAKARASPAARWRSGYAEDCKSLHAGSIPARASTTSGFYDPQGSSISGEKVPLLAFNFWRAICRSECYSAADAG
jgi:hypothetical protein